MKVYFHAPNENWIVDRFKKEWDEDNSDISVSKPEDADVLWICADWCWAQLENVMKAKPRKILVTCHHYVPEKFDLSDFQARDAYVTAYHVPNQHTYDFIRPLTKKRIEIIPYWANQKIWHKTGDQIEFRKKHGIPENAYVVGSFQRDTEGAGISYGEFLPKWEKGPDLFADYVEDLCYWYDKEPFFGYPDGIHVLLAGWRRQYLIARFEVTRVPFTYIEMPSQETLNELYQTLNLYPITARYEGGPQALIEAGLLDIPVVSRRVGMAEHVLKEIALESENEELSAARPLIPDVSDLVLPSGYEPYRKLLASL